MIELGERELDVMKVLWDRGPSTVAEVRGWLNADLAYNTVLTILRNLEAKAAVQREEEGRAHRYSALIERTAVRDKALTRVIDRLFGGRPESAMAHLVESQGLDATQLRALHALLERRLAHSEDEGVGP